jgi:hypothetical protein
MPLVKFDATYLLPGVKNKHIKWALLFWYYLQLCLLCLNPQVPAQFNQTWLRVSNHTISQSTIAILH